MTIQKKVSDLFRCKEKYSIRQELKRNISPIPSTEYEKIGKIVYGLYGITEGERKVII